MPEIGPLIITVQLRGLNQVNSGLNNVAKGTQNLDRNANSLARTMGRVQRTFTAFAALFIARRITRGMIDAVKQFANFEHGMRNIATLMSQGDIERNLGRLSKGVQDLGLESGIALDKLQQGLYDIISAQVPVNDSLKALELSAKAARAGVADLRATTRLGITTMNAYGMSVNELEHIYDVFFVSLKRGVFTFEELTQSISMLIPSAVKAGVSIEEMAGALATITRNGVKMRIAGVALARLFDAMVTPAKIKTFKELGIAVYDDTGKFVGFTKVLEQLAKQYNSMNDEQQAMLAGMLGIEKRAMRAFVPAIKNIEQVKTDTEAARHSTNALSEAYGKFSDDAQVKLDKLNQTWRVFKIQLGETMVNAGLIEDLKWIGKKLIELTEGAKAFNYELWRGGDYKQSELPLQNQLLAVEKQIEKFKKLQGSLWGLGGSIRRYASPVTGESASVNDIITQLERQKAGIEAIIAKRKEQIVVEAQQRQEQEATGEIPGLPTIEQVEHVTSEIKKQRDSLSQYIAQLEDENFVRQQNNFQASVELLKTLKDAHITVWSSVFGFINNGIKTFQKSFSTALSSIILGTANAKEAFKQFGQEMLASIVNFFTEWAAQAIISLTIGKMINEAVAAQALSLAEAWAPAALFASIATEGGAAAVGTASLLTSMGTTQAIVGGLSLGQNLTKHAEGGVITRPTLLADAKTGRVHGIAGEAGEEAIVPLKGQGGAGVTININTPFGADNRIFWDGVAREHIIPAINRNSDRRVS